MSWSLRSLPAVTTPCLYDRYRPCSSLQLASVLLSMPVWIDSLAVSWLPSSLRAASSDSLPGCWVVSLLIKPFHAARLAMLPSATMFRVRAAGMQQGGAPELKDLFIK